MTCAGGAAVGGPDDAAPRVKSALTAVEWPAIPSTAGALALAIQHQLEQTQWWAPAELELQQVEQLGPLLRHAYDTIPFWRERLTAAGYAREGHIDRQWLSSLPLLTRADIQAHGDALLSRAVPHEHGALARGQTSGSSGMPVSFVATELTRFFWRCFTLRDHLWQQRHLGGKLASIRYGVAEGESAGWGESTDFAFDTGRLATLGIAAAVDYQLAWLQRHDPDYLLSFPSNLDELARISLERKIRLPRLREVRAVGETLSPQTRLLVKEAWGVRTTDVYSAQEVGYIALQCPGREHYHAQAEGVIVEVIGEDGVPCKPGEIGRVVVTTLHNFAMPLIRYDIGDFAQAGAPCPCGRGLPVLTRVLGRVRNMLTLPNGRRSWPLLGDIRGSAGGKVKQYQFIQRTREHIDVRLVVSSALTPAEEGRVRATMQRALGHPFDLKFIYCAGIERPAGGKFEEFRSELYSQPMRGAGV